MRGRLGAAVLAGAMLAAVAGPGRASEPASGSVQVQNPVAGRNAPWCQLPKGGDEVHYSYTVVRGHATSGTFAVRDLVTCRDPEATIAIAAHMLRNGVAAAHFAPGGRCGFSASTPRCTWAAGTGTLRLNSNIRGTWVFTVTWAVRGLDAANLKSYRGCTFNALRQTSTCTAQSNPIRIP
jgi:hypothetical protein